MKRFFQYSIIIWVIFSFSIALHAQEATLSKKFKKTTITTLSELMNERYVFPEVAKKTEKHLLKQWEDGHFDDFNSLESFSEALTESVQSINKDKHMRITPKPPYKAPENSPERLIEEQLEQLNRRRKLTAGFYAVKKLEGNVGYLDLRGFASLDRGGPIADNYMKLMATSDAVIIDLRKNGGGSPVMVQYLCSYFFDKKVHLNSLYFRRGDELHEFWTLDEVNGTKMPDVPLFVLTSERTFSGAEEFSYNMQTQKRATLIGQTTGGGANPGGMVSINEKLHVFIPTGRAINPITKTNWEGVGVIPEVKTTPEETMDKAHEMAKKAAEAYRTSRNETFTALLTELQATLGKDAISETLLIKQLTATQQAGLMSEVQINMMGYDYLMQRKKPETAEAIFKANTMLFPNSANVYDSYAETLAANGKLKEAVTYYQKAVDMAKKNGDENLNLFTENLKKVKKQLAEK